MSQISPIEQRLLTPTIGEWLVAMQDPSHLANILSAEILDGGKIRTVFLHQKPLGSYSFSMGVERAVLDIDGYHYPVHSVVPSCHSRIGVPSFYRSVEPASHSYHLRDFYREASFYMEHDPEFSLAELVKAYRQPRFKRSIEGFMVKDKNYRFISTDGLPADSYRVSLFDQNMILHIWDQNFEVEAVRHKNGITLLVTNNEIEAYESEWQPSEAKQPVKKGLSQPVAEPS